MPSPLNALRFMPSRANTPAATMAKILPSTAAGASCATYTSGVDPRMAEYASDSGKMPSPIPPPMIGTMIKKKV
ncbi:hypothetical protein D3C87_1841020 [compost metagenome]